MTTTLDVTVATALQRAGGLSRQSFGKPRGTRAQSAPSRSPVPGHYFPNTSAEFVVPNAPFHVEAYLHAAWLSADADLRREAVMVVAEYGDVSCVGVLGTLLLDNLLDNRCPSIDVVTRQCAAYALASIGGPAAEAILWRALEDTACPLPVREAALDGVLDLLTPDGWQNYTFMNSRFVDLAEADRARLLALEPDFPFIQTAVLSQFSRPEGR